MYDIETCDAWFRSLASKVKAKIMQDRMTNIELVREGYNPTVPDTWWTSKNWAQKSDIYTRFVSVFPTNVQTPKPTKFKSKNKSKRGDKK